MQYEYLSLSNLRGTGRKPSIAGLGLVLIAMSHLIAPPAALAGEADVVAVETLRTGDGTYRFDVTVRHADAGWEHYADKWQVLGPDGAVLGERVLLHPHDTEQPFTRGLTGVKIPDGTGRVLVRAHDKVHGWGGSQLAVELEE